MRPPTAIASAPRMSAARRCAQSQRGAASPWQPVSRDAVSRRSLCGFLRTDRRWVASDVLARHPGCASRRARGRGKGTLRKMPMCADGPPKAVHPRNTHWWKIPACVTSVMRGGDASTSSSSSGSAAPADPMICSWPAWRDAVWLSARPRLHCQCLLYARGCPKVRSGLSCSSLQPRVHSGATFGACALVHSKPAPA